MYPCCLTHQRVGDPIQRRPYLRVVALQRARPDRVEDGGVVRTSIAILEYVHVHLSTCTYSSTPSTRLVHVRVLVRITMEYSSSTRTCTRVTKSRLLPARRLSNKDESGNNEGGGSEGGEDEELGGPGDDGSHQSSSSSSLSSLSVFAICRRRRCQSSRSAVDAVVSSSVFAVCSRRRYQSSRSAVDAVVSLRGLQSTPLSVFVVCRRRRCQSFGTPSTAFVVLEYVHVSTYAHE